MFQSELDFTPLGKDASVPRFLAHHDAFVATQGRAQAVKLGSSARGFGQLHLTNDLNSTAQPAASIAALGKGKIAATYFSIASGYLANHSPVTRQFLAALAGQLFPQPTVEIKGSPDVDVILARKQGKLLVNLVNTSGPHVQEPVIESIPPVGPLSVTIRQAAKPAKVTLEPAGRPLDFEYRDGAIQVTVPRIEIHEVIVVEN